METRRHTRLRAGLTEKEPRPRKRPGLTRIKARAPHVIVMFELKVGSNHRSAGGPDDRNVRTPVPQNVKPPCAGLVVALPDVGGLHHRYTPRGLTSCASQGSRLRQHVPVGLNRVHPVGGDLQQGQGLVAHVGSEGLPVFPNRSSAPLMLAHHGSAGPVLDWLLVARSVTTTTDPATAPKRCASGRTRTPGSIVPAK